MTKAQLDQLEFEASRDPRHVPLEVYSSLTPAVGISYVRGILLSLVTHVFTPDLCAACSLADCDCVRIDKPAWAHGHGYTEGLGPICFPQGEPGAAGIPGEPVRCPNPSETLSSQGPPSHDSPDCVTF